MPLHDVLDLLVALFEKQIQIRLNVTIGGLLATSDVLS